MAPQVHVLRGDGLAERRLRAEHVVARALVEACTFAEAVPRILEAICSALDWEHGALWDIDRQTDVDVAYRDRDDWQRRSLLNIARMGKFSSDRTISEYAREIWRIKPAYAFTPAKSDVKV